MYRYIQRTLDWGVKIASLAITGPATWVVATDLFSDIQSPALLFVMRFAAVFLIEGVLLSNWLLLEFDRKATPEIKARYGLTALAMYVALLVIGWRHEGPTGLVFRIALLAALIGSGWDTYVYTWQLATSRVDRSAENARRVRRHARRLSIKEAIIRRETEHTATLALVSVEGDAALEQNHLYGERLIAGIHLDDKAERLKLIAAEEMLESSNGGSNGKKKRTTTLSQVVTRPGQNTPDSNSDEDLEDQQLTHNILDAFAEDPRYTRRNLAEKLGVSEREVGRAVRELVEAGLLYKEGRAHLLTEKAESRVDGRARGQNGGS